MKAWYFIYNMNETLEDLSFGPFGPSRISKCKRHSNGRYARNLIKKCTGKEMAKRR
jgi:hypothetical protein